MRTTVTLDSQIVRAAQLAAGTISKAKAVMLALNEFIRWHRVAGAVKYRGKLRFRKDTSRARHRGH